MTRTSASVSGQAHGVPASTFGIVLGVGGLGGAWRGAHRVWSLPSVCGETLILTAGVLWTAFLLAYAMRWVFSREEALAEARHPVQCCFLGLVGVSASLIGLSVAPYSPSLGLILFGLGSGFTLSFALWRTGALWRGGRDHAATTPVLYLPLVAGAFVMSTAAATLGYAGGAQLAFGAGLFTWLAIESVLLHRLYTEDPLPLALRPLLGLQLAPPAVGAVAYLSASGAAPDFAARAMLGYALLQGLLLVRMLPWVMEQPFALSYWAFTFGATALANAALTMVERGDGGLVAHLAPYLFAAANITVGLIGAASLRLFARRVAASARGTPMSSRQT
ncbi:dicarboxylate transporter/tellurite-resistance protein TehA [Alsobacter sp. KACC 23698]|uniref:Dicarboxylate transporter/tellurite-resistance protein TehA n=1 Tax=Alsobacter sp. KACC 23698 TaxID=3149229 RepID=A0AAU7JL09_9HYPH